MWGGGGGVGPTGEFKQKIIQVLFSVFLWCKSRKIPVGVCERHKFRKKLARITCCVVHTHQFEFANMSWPIFVCRVKVAIDLNSASV